MKQNCWEFKNCGRQPGGAHIAEFGVCPAHTETLLHGINSGSNAGRACWCIPGTLCGGKVQVSTLVKFDVCMKCEFFNKVWVEEKETQSYTPPAQIIKMLNESKKAKSSTNR